jgi:GntR family transcriptional regulator, transcriptional repressor for pyruvate dehydrogenase complex
MSEDAYQSVVSDALFRPVRSGNAFEDTVARLLQTIRLGIVGPGDALPPERDLATRFSVSRDTVREAIRELAEAGYLVSKRGRYGGTFVTDPVPTPPLSSAPVSASDIEDVLGLPLEHSVRPSAIYSGRDFGMRRRHPPTTIAGSTRDCI